MSDEAAARQSTRKVLTDQAMDLFGIEVSEVSNGDGKLHLGQTMLSVLVQVLLLQGLRQTISHTHTLSKGLSPSTHLLTNLLQHNTAGGPAQSQGVISNLQNRAAAKHKAPDSHNNDWITARGPV